MRTVLSGLFLLLTAAPAFAQFKDNAGAPDASLGRSTTQLLRVGVIVKATGGPLQRVVATMPVPADWPEQQVKNVREDVSPSVESLTFRDIGGGGRLTQMVVEIPFLANGQEARALVTFEVTRSALLPPSDTAALRIPKKLDRELTTDVGASPYIESRHAKIVAAAKEAVNGKTNDWQRTEAIYDWVRTNIKLKSGELKGAARAITDKTGDIDELVSLFVAMCRSQKIPARTVFETNHCYAEFYLEDAKGQGRWFPCQPAGVRAFGSSSDTRPILQKGDNFKDPDNPQQRLRYVTEQFRASGRGGEPNVRFVCELVAE